MRYGGFFLLVLVVFTLARFWLWIAVAAAVVLLLVALWKFTGWLDRWLERRERRREQKRLELAAVAHRADQQHAAFLAGDKLSGVYGDYPPVTP